MNCGAMGLPNDDYIKGAAVECRQAAEKDFEEPVLAGHGDTDYARYMRTGALLSLQRVPEEMAHRDELMFQTVHQSTELWLKHACFEVEEAARQVAAGHLGTAVRLLARASLGIELVTGQLEMLRHLSPWDFQTIRTVLGHGSGFESPGWRSVQAVSTQLREAFDELSRRKDVNLVGPLPELPRGPPVPPLRGHGRVGRAGGALADPALQGGHQDHRPWRGGNQGDAGRRPDPAAGPQVLPRAVERPDGDHRIGPMGVSAGGLR
jgi:hypothetical protein